MLNITIEDTETGKVITREGKFVFLHTAEKDGAETVTHGSGTFNRIDVVRCMMAHDFIRERMFDADLLLRAAYDVRRLFLHQEAVVDRAELERQMKGGGSE